MQPANDAALSRLVSRNDANASRIWLQHASSIVDSLSGASLVPLYRCFSPRAGASQSFNQLTAPLLLIGMNPSAPIPQRTRGHTWKNWTSDDFRWNGPPSKDALSHLKEYEWTAESEYERHFSKYRSLARAATGDAEGWAHLDMFLVRQSVQRQLDRQFYQGRRGGRVLHPFFADQFRQFEWTLRAHNPRAVVILNRGVSTIALRELHLRPIEDVEGTPYPLHAWDEMPGVPFVLGSTLSGRGALNGIKLQRFVESVKRAVST